MNSSVSNCVAEDNKYLKIIVYYLRRASNMLSHLLNVRLSHLGHKHKIELE